MKRAVLLGTGFLLLLVAAAAGIALAVRPVAVGVPLDPGIPNERALIARGLSGVPSPGQPASPVVVERVVTDGLATYVQFHMVAPAGRSPTLALPSPSLSGVTGAAVNAGYGTNIILAPPTALPLPAWVPWRPPVLVRGVMQFGPLPPTVRAAVLRFTPAVSPITPAGSGGWPITPARSSQVPGETVRVPLTLAALRRVRPYAGALVRRQGLHLRVVAARDTGLALGFSPFGLPGGVTLTDARGRGVPLTVLSRVCTGQGSADIQLPCRWVWAYPPQRRGARLTLTISGFVADTPNSVPPGAVVNAVGAGPWRLPVVIP